MPKHGNKQFRQPGITSRAPVQIIPGLGVDVPELQQARALWQIGRFDEAVDLFERAVRKYPQNLVALVDASRALGARFEITRAEVLLDRMVRLAANNPRLMHLAGQSYRMIFRPDKAIECFKRVLGLTKSLSDACLELAVLYERRHRVSEALALIEDCLRAEPDYLEAELFKARLLRRLKDSPAADTLFRKLAEAETKKLNAAYEEALLSLQHV
jgi:tetratricopeptide (TPR) repeat protein